MPGVDPVPALKLRLREDIRAAMKDRRKAEVDALRSLAGAIDQAEAVPVEHSPGGALGVQFGDPAAEVARRKLTADDLRALIRAECDEARNVAADLEKRGMTAEVERYRVRAAIVERYLDLV